MIYLGLPIEAKTRSKGFGASGEEFRKDHVGWQDHVAQGDSFQLASVPYVCFLCFYANRVKEKLHCISRDFLWEGRIDKKMNLAKWREGLAIRLFRSKEIR